MDVLSWSRHHRLFPGEGTFDLAAFVGHVLAAGYDGPLSLEVFNDTFRQTDPGHTAVHALRSLLWLQDKLGLIPVQDAKPPTGFDFVELKAEDTSEVEVLLGQLGFTPRGRHRTKPVSLWVAGDARVVLNEQQGARSGPTRRRRRIAGARRRRHLPALRRSDGTGRVPADLRRRATFRCGDGSRRDRVLLGHRDSRWTDLGERIRKRLNGTHAELDPDHRPRQPDPAVADRRGRGVVPDERVRPRRRSADRGAGAVRAGAQPGVADPRRRHPDPAQCGTARAGREEPAAARRVRLHRRRRAGPLGSGRRPAVPGGAGQLLRLPAGPVRPRRGLRRAVAAAEPALRPEPPRPLRALLHPHRRHGVLRVRAALRPLRRLRRRQRTGAPGRAAGRVGTVRR